MNSCLTPMKAAINLFRETELRLRAPACSMILWERHLTPAERKLLGGSINDAHDKGRAAGMWASLRGCTQQRAVLEVAHLLNLLSDGDFNRLKQEFQGSLTSEDALQHAIEQNALVVDEESRSVYWKGEMIDYDWKSNVLWVFFWELARNAKSNKPIDRLMFGNRAPVRAVTNWKSRLKKNNNIPRELLRLIKPKGRGELQLMLEATEVRIIERHPTGEIKEWNP